MIGSLIDSVAKKTAMSVVECAAVDVDVDIAVWLDSMGGFIHSSSPLCHPRYVYLFHNSDFENARGDVCWWRSAGNLYRSCCGRLSPTFSQQLHHCHLERRMIHEHEYNQYWCVVKASQERYM